MTIVTRHTVIEEVKVGIQGPQGTPLAGPKGDDGDQGVQGNDGVKGDKGDPGTSTIIVGSFGRITIASDLPTSGIIPVNFDGAGIPSSQLTLSVGQSLNNITTGDLYTYVSTSVDPSGWLNVGHVQGPPGPQGSEGDSGVQGIQGVKGDVGAPGLVATGAFVPGGSGYSINDVVEYLGSSYRCKVAGATGDPVTNSGNKWELLVSKGDTGDAGEQGPEVGSLDGGNASSIYGGTVAIDGGDASTVYT